MITLLSWNLVGQLSAEDIAKMFNGKKGKNHIDNLAGEILDNGTIAASIQQEDVNKICKAANLSNISNGLMIRLSNAVQSILPCIKKNIDKGTNATPLEQLLLKWLELMIVVNRDKSSEMEHLMSSENGVKYLESQKALITFCSEFGTDSLPENSQHSHNLLRFLCRSVNKNDASLHRAIQTFIKRYLNGNPSIDINRLNHYDRTVFDDFQDNGGNMAVLMKGIDQNLLKRWASKYIKCNEQEIKNIPSGDAIMALYVPDVRWAWISNSTSLDFLKEKQLKALAEYVDANIPTSESDDNRSIGKLYLKQWIPVIAKMEEAQKSIFIKALSQHTNTLLLAEYQQINTNANPPQKRIKLTLEDV